MSSATIRAMGHYFERSVCSREGIDNANKARDLHHAPCLSRGKKNYLFAPVIFTDIVLIGVL
jgi:hypothetical protein